MNGPSEFHCIGSLRTWDITDRLPEIDVPTLLVSGAHDEATPLIVGTIHERIPGARWELFEDSSHMPHVEEPERFLEVVEAFLATSIEVGAARARRGAGEAGGPPAGWWQAARWPPPWSTMGGRSRAADLGGVRAARVEATARAAGPRDSARRRVSTMRSRRRGRSGSITGTAESSASV